MIFGAHHVPPRPRPRPFSVRQKPLKGMCGNLPRAAIVLLLPSHTTPHLVVPSPSDIAVRPPVPPRTSPHLPFRPRLPCRSHLPLYSTQSQSTPALSLIAAAQGQIYTDAFGHASRPIPVPISLFSLVAVAAAVAAPSADLRIGRAICHRMCGRRGGRGRGPGGPEGEGGEGGMAGDEALLLFFEVKRGQNPLSGRGRASRRRRG